MKFYEDYAPVENIFDGIGKRSKGNVVRKENKFLDIRVDGSKHEFTHAQIKLFSEIITKADEFFELCPPESEKYDIRGIAWEIPIILVPYETFVEQKNNRCSAFTKMMQKKYNEELEQIPQNLSKEEIERRMEILRKKYGPWLACSFPNPNCHDCKRVWSTPLGYYVPDDSYGKIYICLDKIIDLYPDKVDAIAAKVILHEFGHALMHNADYSSYQTAFDYWVEESLANKIALKYLAVASELLGKQKLFMEAKEMVEQQSDAYKLGLYLFEHNASDWHTLQVYKTNINQNIGDQWVNAVCEKTKDYTKIQKLFYTAFLKPTISASTSTRAAFEAWVPNTYAKEYAAVIYSVYYGMIFKEIMGWSYDTVADCTNISEIEQLRDYILDKSHVSERDLNMGSNNCISAALKKYSEYLGCVLGSI